MNGPKIPLQYIHHQNGEIKAKKKKSHWSENQWSENVGITDHKKQQKPGLKL